MDKDTVNKMRRIYLVARAFGLNNFDSAKKEDLNDLKYFIQKTIEDLDHAYRDCGTNKDQPKR